MFHRALLLALSIVAAAARAESLPDDPAVPAADEFRETAAGHGSVSLTYAHYYENGVWATAHKKVPFGTVHDQNVGFEGSYNVSDEWAVFGGIRYTNNVARPIGQPEQTINAWQDIALGTSWHRRFGNYDFAGLAVTNIPSHDYPVAGGAYTGQDLQQLLIAASVAHQFDFTNFYYKLGYGYAFSQKVVGVNTGYTRFDAELGWFVNDRLTVRGFLTGRGGFGLSSGEFDRLKVSNPALKPNRARVSEHSYRAWGFGLDYDLGNHYVASVNAQHLYWGATVFNIDYAVEARLTRNF